MTKQEREQLRREHSVDVEVGQHSGDPIRKEFAILGKKILWLLDRADKCDELEDKLAKFIDYMTDGKYSKPEYTLESIKEMFNDAPPEAKNGESPWWNGCYIGSCDMRDQYAKPYRDALVEAVEKMHACMDRKNDTNSSYIYRIEKTIRESLKNIEKILQINKGE